MDVVKLGILGGTFDPVHNGHLHLAQAAYRSLNLSQVLFVPAGDPPHKQDMCITAIHHRLRMLELAVGEQLQWAVSTVDLDRPGPHYTVDTVAHIRAKFHLIAEDCYFIIGTDSLIDLPTWHQPEKLLELCRLAVVHRPTYQPNLTALNKQLPTLGQNLAWVKANEMSVSSTKVRAHLQNNHPINNLIPPPVYTYIQQHHLYK